MTKKVQPKLIMISIIIGVGLVSWAALIGMIGVPSPAGQQIAPRSQIIGTVCETPLDGMVITQDMKFCPGIYVLPNGISVGVDDVELDCNGAELRGLEPDSYINQITGITMLGINGSTIKNCKITFFANPITLDDSHHNTIREVETNLNLGGIILDQSSFNSVKDSVIDEPGGSVGAMNSSSNTIEQNELNGPAVFHFSENNVVQDNQMGGNIVLLYSSTPFPLSDNVFQNCFILPCGYLISFSPGLTINGNTMSILDIENSPNIETYQNTIVLGGLGTIDVENSENVTVRDSSMNIEILIVDLTSTSFVLKNNTILTNILKLSSNKSIVEMNDVDTLGSFELLGSHNEIVNNEIVKNLTFLFPPPPAFVINGHYNSIRDNNLSTIEETDSVLLFGDGNTLEDNTIESLNEDGLILSGSDNILINNSQYGGHGGILFDHGKNNTLHLNRFSDNTYNFLINGSKDEHFVHDIDTTNFVDEKPIYYLVNASNQFFDGTTNAGFFACILCDTVGIKDIQVENLGDGVLFWNTKNSFVLNVISSNSLKGISLFHSDNNSLSNNTVKFNVDSGMIISESDGNTIVSTNAYNNPSGIVFGRGIFLKSATGNIIKSGNMVGHKEGIYLLNSQDNNITSTTSSLNDYGIHVESSIGNIVFETVNTVNKISGIFLEGSSTISLLNNTVGFSPSGIFVDENSPLNIIRSNIIRDDIINYTVGIRIDSDNNQLLNNEMMTNAVGTIISGNSNSLAFNNFIDNGEQAFDFGQNNKWDTGAFGNHWSDYNESSEGCLDINLDDICDSPYLISGGGQDNFPSVNPF